MAGAGCFTYALIMSALCLAAFLYMIKSSYYAHYTNIEKSEKTGIFGLYFMKSKVLLANNYTMLLNPGKLPKMTKDMVLKILSRVWVYALALTITKITTLAIYPGAGSLVEPVNPTDSDWHQIYFTQVQGQH